jgi:hypothetical protein
MPTYCREKYIDGKLVSRLCILDDRDLFMVKSDYPAPQYEIAQVSACDACPTFPTGSGISREEIISLIEQILREKFGTMKC